MPAKTASGKETGPEAEADIFMRELNALAAQVSAAWQGPQDASAAIREQRREPGNDGH